MKRIYAIGILSFLLIGSIIFCLIYADMNAKAQNRVIALEKDLNSLEEEMKAIKSNSEIEINNLGEHYLKTMFTFDIETAPDVKNELVSLSTGKAKEMLTETDKHVHEEEYGDIAGDITSSVKILESTYNKTESDAAKVIIEFEQTLIYDHSKEKTLNEMVLDLKFVNGEWKISNYKMKQLL